MEKTILEERKKTIYQFICDEFYVPMKAKEIGRASCRERV